MAELFRYRKWDLVGRRNIWFAISLLIIVPGLYAWATRGLNKGIDFTGGGLITYQLQQSVPAGREPAVLEQAKQSLQERGIEARLQVARQARGKDQLLVRTQITPQKGKTESQVLEGQKSIAQEELDRIFPGITQFEAWTVTPVVSAQLLRNALKAVAFGCLFILFWVWVRYAGVQWGFCALVALVHDVLVLIGVFALTQKEVNSPFVAAALTVVGFSVHDTIVIFDRIRENLRLRKGSTFAETTNISLLETMARSVNTVLTVELVLIAVYFFGGASLRDFVFAMIVGVTTGAYSSIFNASQLMVVLRNRQERKAALRRAQPGRQPAPTTRRAAQAAGSPARAPAAVPPRPAPAQATRGAAPSAPLRTGLGGEPDDASGRAGAAQQGVVRPTAGPASEEAGTPTSRASRKKMKAAGKRKRRF